MRCLSILLCSAEVYFEWWDALLSFLLMDVWLQLPVTQAVVSQRICHLCMVHLNKNPFLHSKLSIFPR